MRLKDFSLKLVYQVVLKFVAIAIGLYTTRWLIQYTTESVLSDYNVALGYINIVLIAVNFGIPNIIQKFYTNKKQEFDTKDFWTTMMLLRFVSYFFGLILIFFSILILKDISKSLIIGVYSLVFILIVDLSYRSITDAYGKTWQYSVTDVFSKLVLVAGLLVYKPYFEGTDSLSYFLWVSFISYILTILIDATWQWKYTGWGSFKPEILRHFIRPLGYIAATNILIGLYNYSDKIFLKLFNYSDLEIVSYSNAYKIYELAIVLPGLTIPSIASYAKNRFDTLDQNKIEKFLGRFGNFKSKFILYTGISIFIAVLASLVLLISSNIIFSLIDPENKYYLSPQPVIYLAIGIIPGTIMSILSYFTLFYHGEKYELIINSIVCFAGILTYLIMIPRFGIVGAAIGNIIIYTTGMLLEIFCLKKLLSKKPRDVR